MMEKDLLIRSMTRTELDVLVDWAAQEGWNPGIHDAEIFWNTDPEGFIAAELDGELIGGGSIVSYDGLFGFMGFFIVKPAFRGQGLGTRLWFARRKKLEARLNPPVCIGMDGVFSMQEFYAKGGFHFSHRDIRYEGVGQPAQLAHFILDLDQVSFDALLRYDSLHFPAPRPQFLKAWIIQSDSRALGAVKDDRLCGYGVIRLCRRGFKIGPLFADEAPIALELFKGLSDAAAGQPIFLDIPENNPAAIELARGHKMQEVFGCARMYFGPTPGLPDHEIFGVTTFELG